MLNFEMCLGFTMILTKTKHHDKKYKKSNKQEKKQQQQKTEIILPPSHSLFYSWVARRSFCTKRNKSKDFPS